MIQPHMDNCTLDGTNTFHATQLAAWQRGPPEDVTLSELRPGSNTKLTVPEVMDTLHPANIQGKAEPSYTNDFQVETEWYMNSDATESNNQREAEAKDMTFYLIRQEDEKQTRTSWTVFNKSASAGENAPEQSTLGFLPMIQAPAHEFDTLNTAVKRCMHISEEMGQKFTVITVDQALYCKLMELKWSVPEYKRN